MPISNRDMSKVCAKIYYLLAKKKKPHAIFIELSFIPLLSYIFVSLLFGALL